MELQYCQGSRRRGRVSHVESKQNYLIVWIQFEMLKVKNLQMQILQVQDHFKSKCTYIDIRQLQASHIYYAYSKRFNIWRRARIIPNVVEGRNVVVRFIDYGDTEIISVSDMCLADIGGDGLATECILADVYPLNGMMWSDFVVQFCNDYLLPKDMLITLVDCFDNRLAVRLEEIDGSMSFANLLQEKGFALLRNTSPPPQLQPSNSYPPITLHNNEMLVILSYIDKVGKKLYVQAASNIKDLNDLMETIQKYVIQPGLGPLRSVHLESSCVVQSSDDGLFYRGKITDIAGQRCRVRLVDYGRSEIKLVSDLKEIHSNFMTLSAQAIECISDQFEVFDLEVSDKVLSCCLVPQKNGIYFAKFKEINILSTNSDGFSKSSYYCQPLNPGSAYEVITSHIESPLLFYCQLKQHLPKIEGLRPKLKSEYKNHDSDNYLTIDKCLPGLPVCAKFSDDGEWYRSEIIEVNDRYNVTVFFVDYGNTEIVPITDIRLLKSNMIENPKYAYKCSLAEIEGIPSDYLMSDSVISCFEDIAMDVVLVADVKEIKIDSYIMNLHLMSKCPQINISKEIRDRFFANVSVKFPELSKVEKIYITSFESPDLFFGQFLKNSNDLTKLQEQINEYYQTNKCNICSFTVGQFVCAQFKEDNTYYRGRILFIADSYCDILFVDYGGRQQTELENIKRLMPQFAKLPAQGIECAFDHCPANVPVDNLRDLMLDHICEVELCRQIQAEIKWAVCLTETYSGNAPALELIRQHEVSGPNVTLQNPDISVGSQEVVVITDISSPDNFCCQLQKNLEEFEVMMSRMEAWYNRGALQDNIPPNPQIPFFCVAKYSEDNSWYRACLTRTHHTGEVEVQFVDFGNHEKTTTNNVKILRTEFASLPIQAVNCSLHGLTNSSFSNADIKKFTEIALNNEYTAVFKSSANAVYKVDLCDESHTSLIKIFKPDTAPPGFDQVHNIKSISSNTSLKIDKADNWNILPSANLPVSNYSVKNSTTTSSNEELYKSNKFNSQKSEFGNLVAHAKQEDSFDISIQTNSKMKTNYTNIKIPFKAYRNVSITHINSPAEFFCHLDENESALDELMENISNVYSNLGPNDLKIKNFVGDSPCCAIYSEDSCWYRAKILQVQNSSVLVEFVDYGNSEEMPINNVRALKEEFLQLEVQAIKCGLYAEHQNSAWNKQKFMKTAEASNHIACFEKQDNSGTYLIKLISEDKIQSILNAEFEESKNTSDSTTSRELEESKNISDSTTSRDFNQSSHFNQSSTFSSSPPPKPPPKSAYAFSSASSFKRIAINEGDKKDVTVTWVLSPVEFYCQLTSAGSEFDGVMRRIQEVYKDIGHRESMVDSIRPNAILVAQFTQDNAWYRAQVLQVDGNQVKVHYVDYGNVEVLNSDRIKKLGQEFADIPLFSAKCKLRGIELPREDVPSKKLLEKIARKYFTENTTCTFLTKKEDCFIVDLYKDGNNVANEMINERFALPDSSLLYSVESSSEVPPTSSISSQVPIISKFAITPKIGDALDVFVSYSINSLNFWCQLSNSEDTLNFISATIQSQISSFSSETSLVKNIVPGMACIAQFCEDEQWYRAEVQNISSNIVNLHFIDYGNSVTVDKSQVKCIIPELVEIPAQCFHCALFESPLEISLEKSAKLFGMTTDKPVTALVKQVKGNIVVVSLIDKSGDTELNIGHEIFGEPEVSLIPTKENIGDTFICRFPPLQLPKGGYQSAYILDVTSIDHFYAQLSTSITELETFTENLNSIYTQSEISKLNDIFTSAACCTIYSEDQSWYRAEIIDVKGDAVNVIFVDYGNKECVDKNLLKQLVPQFQHQPPFAILCSLDGIMPVEGNAWSQEIIDCFLTMTSDKEIQVQFLREELPALVNLKDENGYIAQQLIEAGLALKSKSENNVGYPELSVPLGKISATVSYIESLDKFYAMCESTEEKFAKLSQMLQATYGPMSENDCILNEVNALQPCAAKFSEDLDWYRAIITDVSGDLITVQFVDYGNVEVTTLQSLKQLLPEFLIDPPSIFEISLFDCDEFSERKDKVKEHFEKLEGTFLEMEVLDQNKPYKVKLFIEGVDFRVKFINEVLASEEENSYQEKHVNENLDKQLQNQTQEINIESEVSKASFQIDDRVQKEVSDHTIEPGAVNKENTNDNFTCKQEELSELSDESKTICEDEYFEDVLPSNNKSGDSLEVVINEEISTQVDKLDSDFNLLEVKDDTIATSEISEDEYITGEEESLADKGIPQSADEETEYFSTGDAIQFPTKDSFMADTSDSFQLSLNEISSNIKDNSFIIQDPNEAESQRLSQYLASLLDEDGKSVNVSHIEDGDNFYAIPVKFYDSFLSLHSEIQNIYGTLTSDVTKYDVLPSEITEFCLYAVRCETNKNWYRAKVTRIDQDKIYVHFIDYGYCQITDAAFVKNLPESLRETSPLANNYFLYGIKVADDKSEASKEKLKELIEGKTCTLDVPDENYPQHVILTVDSIDIVEQLLQTDMVVNDMDSFQEMPYNICFDAEVHVTISHLISPNEFCIQFEDQQEELDKLMGEIATFYKTPDIHNSLNWTFEEPCIAIYGGDGQWYRGRVENILQDHLTIYFIDFGYVEDVPRSLVKKLVPQFLKLSPLALRCSLDDTAPPEGTYWNESSLSKFQELTGLMQTLTAIFHDSEDDIYFVSLFRDGVNVREKLVELGIARSLKKSSENSTEDFSYEDSSNDSTTTPDAMISHIISAAGKDISNVPSGYKLETVKPSCSQLEEETKLEYKDELITNIVSSTLQKAASTIKEFKEKDEFIDFDDLCFTDNPELTTRSNDQSDLISNRQSNLSDTDN